MNSTHTIRTTIHWRWLTEENAAPDNPDYDGTTHCLVKHPDGCYDWACFLLPQDHINQDLDDLGTYHESPFHHCTTCVTNTNNARDNGMTPA